MKVKIITTSNTDGNVPKALIDHEQKIMIFIEDKLVHDIKSVTLESRYSRGIQTTILYIDKTS